MKIWLQRAAAGMLALYLILRINSAAGGIFRVVKKIGERTYRTPSELTAMFLIFCIVFLLFGGIGAVHLALTVVAGERKNVAGAEAFVLFFLFFLYACFYGYPLLDNNFTTAWLMTGKYTATLLKSLLSLLAGVFAMSFDWNNTLAWYVVSACLLVCPFVLLAAFLGLRNFLPVISAALFPSAAWLTGHWALLPGRLQALLGLASSVVAALLLYSFTDERKLGTEGRRKRGGALIRVKVDRKKRTLILGICIALWVLTVLAGRIRSFGAVMRLIFSSSVYFYRNNLYALADRRIALALLISYLSSLIIKWIFTRISFEDESRAARYISSACMLLVQVWVLPLLSNFMTRAAEAAEGAVSGEAVKEAVRMPAEEFLGVLEQGSLIPLILSVVITGCLLFFLFFFTVRLPFVRMAVWFFVWFAACTYVYCLIGLFYHSPLGDMTLLLLCYLLNSALNVMLSSGKRLRRRVKAL